MLVITHGLDETDTQMFNDRIKTDMNKLFKLMEDVMKISMPEISKIQRVRKYKSDSRCKQQQIRVVFNDNNASEKVRRYSSNLKRLRTNTNNVTPGNI